MRDTEELAWFMVFIFAVTIFFMLWGFIEIGIQMKCKGCNADITKNLVMVEDAYGDRATRVLGIETDPENFSSDAYMDGDGETKEGDFETILGDVIDEDIWFEHAFYQCNKCHREYSWEEIKEIFK